MGGKKRKIPMEKIEKKESRSVAFSKRREGLYRKASELCLLCDARIAILATPPSAKSNVSFYSFGHPSVDDVVDAFLQNRIPPLSLSDDPALKNKYPLASKTPSPGLGFRWEEEGFEETNNKQDLEAAIAEISELMNKVRLRQNQMKNQRPCLAEKNLGESSGQGLDGDGGKIGTLAGNLAPQVSYQTERISEDFNTLEEDMANADISFEELKAGSLHEDPLDPIEWDDFFSDLPF